jgi:hypothetical protein
VDVRARGHNPGGRIDPSQFRFPYSGVTFDVALVSSVFTHMLPDGVERCMKELSRF